MDVPKIKIDKRIKGRSQGLMFKKYDHLNIYGYTDANWVGSGSDKSQHSDTIPLLKVI